MKYLYKYFEPIVLFICGILLIAASLSSCGGEYKVAVDPVQVDVKHTIDLYEIRKAFEALCKDELVTYTNQELTECVDAKIADFLEALAD